MDEELWRDWPQDPRVKVSNKGKVISCKRGACYPLKVSHNNNGGCQASISNCLAGKQSTHRGYHFEYVRGQDD